jgi:glycosyltransferase involved in cell wall biosynthesis
VLIHRTVFEKVAEEYGNTWFERLPGPNGLRGEDISFFIRAGAAGFGAWIHTGIRTNHHKNIWVSEIDFWESFHAPPATETVDVIVPTVRPRAGNIPELATSLKASTGLARLILVVDDEDHEAELAQYGDTVIFPGSFARKINAAYPHTTAPWIQVVGDDCRFHPGWLDHAQQTARLHGAKVVGSNDLANPRVVRGEHATHWMIDRSYIDEVGASWDGPGIVAHEGYRHWFVDDEIVAAAKQRGVFQMALGAKIEHLHPIAGKADTDEVYEKNDKYAAQDRDLFEKRLKANV